jgi:catechol-2,3-dioxygenase
VDHGFIESIYLRDPNGYVIELTAKTPAHDSATGDGDKAHHVLHRWQQSKTP